MLNPENQQLNDIADHFVGLDYQLPGVIPRFIYALTLGRPIDAVWASAIQDDDTVVTWTMLAISGDSLIKGTWKSDAYSAGYPAASIDIKAEPFPDEVTIKPTEIRNPGYRHSNDSKYTCFYEVTVGDGEAVTMPARPAQPDAHDRADKFVAALVERMNPTRQA